MKLFGLLISCTGLILIFSHLGTKAYDTVFKEQSPVFSNGTMIGTIPLNGMSSEEAENELNIKIQEWSKISSFSLQYQNKTTELPDNIISIDAKDSIKDVHDGQRANLAVVVDKSLLEEAINKTIDNKDIIKDLDIEKLEGALISSVQQFQAEPAGFQLLAFLKSDGKNANNELAVSKINGIASQNKNLEAILSELTEIEIEPNETFSFQNIFDSNKFDSEALSIIASSVYEAILPTNFMIIERNISKQLPAYSSLGSEAKVSDKMNLVFNNPNPYSYKLSFNLSKDSLQTKLMGPPFPYKYSVRKETESFSPKTVLQFSAKQAPTQTKILEKGKKALLAKVYREAKDDRNQIIETTFISEDFYPPVHRVEQLGLIPPEGNDSGNNNDNIVANDEQNSEDLNNGSDATNMLPADTDVDSTS